MAAAFAALLLWANGAYFFRAAQYPLSDRAANTLSVLRAGHFQEIHGVYSRWGFRHPGPAIFYGTAFAEAALHRWFHLVPAADNAQVLFTTFLTLCFLAAALCVAARWVRGGVFLFVAVALAILHFAAVDGNQVFLSTWTPHLTPTIFCALLVAAASVAAGQGEDLPLLMLAGCLLLHIHVAQPLFVGPMFLFAYAGLAWACWRRRGAVLKAVPLETTDDLPSSAVTNRPASALPWRVYPGTHRFALLLAVLFALPILVDLCLGSNSNFSRILEHSRTYRGEYRSFPASLDYFLRFAIYVPSLPNKPSLSPDHVAPHDVLVLVLRHPAMMLPWLVALFAPLVPLAVRRWLGHPTTLLSDALIPPPAPYASPAGRWRFLTGLWMAWVLSVGLTLSWGMMQDGDLFYFNAWFNYGIWYILALFAAGCFVDALDAIAARSDHPFFWCGGVAATVAALAVVTVVRHPQRFQAGVDEAGVQQEQTAVATLSNEPAGTPRAKLLLFPSEAWTVATGLAVTLIRHERNVSVLPAWGNMFGDDLILQNWADYVSKPSETNPPFQVWHVVPAAAAPTGSVSMPLAENYALVPGGLPIDPNANFRLVCGGPASNYDGYVCMGWAPPGDRDASWTEDKMSWLQFQPRPVPTGADVTLTFDFSPFLPPGKRTSQRVEASLNGLNLGTLQVTGEDGSPNRFTIPGSLWNKYASVLLVLQFPDAISPRAAGTGGDPRRLAFQIRSVTFAATTPTAVSAEIPTFTPEGKPVPATSPTKQPNSPVMPTEISAPEALPMATPVSQTAPATELESKPISSPESGL